MATKNLIIRGGADFSGMKKEMLKAQKTLENFKNNVSSTMRKIGGILGTLAVGKIVKDTTQMAMSVESAMDNINRNMGESAQAFDKWVKTQSQALGMGRADAYKYGSTFSNLLSSFTTSAQDTAEQTTELMKAAAIIASKTGRTYEDVSERIRSGLLGSTEAIEDLGVYTNISMIESTEAFRQFAGDKSWSQLDFQTQQQIRLAAILEQTYARYGDTLADTTQTRHAQFIASLQNIKLTLGQAFLPIYNVVLPALTSMVNAIGRVVNVIAQFFQALFGKAPEKQAQQTAKAVTQQATAVGGLGNAVKKAGKEAKKVQGSVAGFDEINSLADTSSSGSGGSGGSGGDGGASGGTPALDTTAFTSGANEISAKAQELANKVKQVFSNVTSFLSKHKDSIISILSGIVAGFAAFKIISKWKNIIGVFKLISAAITGISWPIVAVAAVIGTLVAAIVYLWRTNEEFRNNLIQIWEAIKSAISSAMTTVFTFLLGIWDKIKTFWDENGAQILQAVQNVFNGIFKVIGFIMPAVLALIKTIWSNVKGVINGALDVIMGFLKIFAGLFTGDWEKMWEGVKRFIKGALEFVWNLFELIMIGKLLGGIKTLITKGLGFFKTFATSTKEVFTSFVNAIKSAFNGILNFLKNIFTGQWNKAFSGIKETFNGLVKSGSKAWEGIKNVFRNIPEWFRSKFNDAWTKVKNVFSSGGKVFSGIKDGIASTFRTIVNKLISGINTIIRVPFNKINGMLNTIRDISFLGISPFKNLWGRNPLSVPQIPKLAKGGITSGPMLAMVGDNPGGKEVISPLDKLQDMMASTVGNAVLSALQFGNSNQSGDVILQIDGKTLARVLNPYSNGENVRIGGNMLRTT